MYRRRNEIERLSRRFKGFRRVFSRFDKLDVMFKGFISLALIVDGVRYREQTLGSRARTCSLARGERQQDTKAKASVSDP